MHIEFAGLTHAGRRRSNNEDSFATDPDLGLYVLCDGIGGHNAGEIASTLAVQTVRTVVGANRNLLNAFAREDTAEGRATLKQVVEQAAETACAQVFNAAQSDPDKAGMGTTLVMVLIANGVGFAAYVGDSRLYVKRGDEVHQLSEDHSFVNEVVRSGRMTREQAIRSPAANVITRAVGTHETVQVDTLAFDLLPADVLLLCSDGLSDYFDDAQQLAPFLSNPSMDDAAQMLIDYANTHGGKDNVTAVVVRSRPEAGEDRDSQRLESIRLKLSVLKKVRLFRHLTYKEVVDVMSLTREQHHGPGITLIREGEQDDDFFVVLDGRVEVSQSGHALAELLQGDHFGEMELVAPRPRSATVATQTDTSVLVIKRDDFIALLKSHEQIAVKLLWSFSQTLAARLHDTNLQVAGVKDAGDDDASAPF